VLFAAFLLFAFSTLDFRRFTRQIFLRAPPLAATPSLRRQLAFASPLMLPSAAAAAAVISAQRWPPPKAALRRCQLSDTPPVEGRLILSLRFASRLRSLPRFFCHEI